MARPNKKAKAAAAKLPSIVRVPYKAKIAEAILEDIKLGASLRTACAKVSISPARLFEWAAESPVFKEQLAQARKIFATMLAEETIGIADYDDTAMARNRIAARQWLASKYDRDQFGDKVEHKHVHLHETFLDELVLPDYMKPKPITQTMPQVIDNKEIIKDNATDK